MKCADDIFLTSTSNYLLISEVLDDVSSYVLSCDGGFVRRRDAIQSLPNLSWPIGKHEESDGTVLCSRQGLVWRHGIAQCRFSNEVVCWVKQCNAHIIVMQRVKKRKIHFQWLL